MIQSNHSLVTKQQQLSFSFKNEAPTMAYKALYDLAPASLSNRSPRTLSFSRTAPASLLIPQHAEPAPASGPLHLLFSLS